MLPHDSGKHSDTAMAGSPCLSEEPVTQLEVQRLPMNNELFAEGNLRRGVLAKQTAVSRGDEPLPQHSHSGTEAMCDEHAWECASCGHLLLTARQLDLHVQEVHDSFFQAQAARSMKVFRCLVEGCDKKFTAPVERKQHLADFHRFPRGYQYDTLHLGKVQASPGPWKAERHNSSRALAPQAHVQSPSRVQETSNNLLGDHGKLAGDAKNADDASGTASASDILNSMDEDGLATSLSKLSSCDSIVPDVATFGRRNRRRAFS